MEGDLVSIVGFGTFVLRSPNRLAAQSVEVLQHQLGEG